MLHASGLLTLDLALAAFDEGFGLKDATPWNVLFHGPTPVFVDWLSLERRDPHDPTWLPYAQFVRTFLLPLIAHREFKTPLDQIFLSRRDGLDPEDVYRSVGPAGAAEAGDAGQRDAADLAVEGSTASDAKTWAPKRIDDAERARYVLRSVFTRLRRAMVRLTPGAAASQWTGYMAEKSHYSDTDFAAKERFVQSALDQVRPAVCSTSAATRGTSARWPHGQAPASWRSTATPRSPAACGAAPRPSSSTSSRWW